MVCFSPHTAVGGMALPQEYCEHSVSGNTSLAMLLPALRGPGLCATVLVHYITHIHNSFIEEYAKLTRYKYVGNSCCQQH